MAKAKRNSTRNRIKCRTSKSKDRSEQIRATNDAIIDQKQTASLEKQIALQQIKHEASFSGGFTDASDKMLDDASTDWITS